MKLVTYEEELDSAICKWLKTARHSNIFINFNIFKEKAPEFAKSLEFHDFHVSEGWLAPWEKRFIVGFKTASGN